MLKGTYQVEAMPNSEKKIKPVGKQVGGWVGRRASRQPVQSVSQSRYAL